MKNMTRVQSEVFELIRDKEWHTQRELREKRGVKTIRSVMERMPCRLERRRRGRHTEWRLRD